MGSDHPYSQEWLHVFKDIADRIARKSKDSTKVGALLIGPDKDILMSTFNGPPIGVNDTLPERSERPIKYAYNSHAEQNLIAFAARRGLKTEGMTVYCTHNPCSSCIRSLLQGGIKTILYDASNSFVSDSEEDRRAVVAMCIEVGVQIHPIVFDSKIEQPTEDIAALKKELYELKEMVYLLSIFAGIHSYNIEYFDTRHARKQVKDLFSLYQSTVPISKEDIRSLIKRWLSILKEQEIKRH